MLALPQCADQLRQRDAVPLQPAQVGLDLVGLGRTAPTVTTCATPGTVSSRPRDHPVLYGAKVRESEVRRTGQLVAVDLSDQAGGLDLGRHAVGQGDVLLKAQRGLRVREVVVDAVFEGSRE